ncbi:integrase domain-containing protein [Vibrio artabrorum]|uniref:Integrase domain-containing protein n=1 Tax=Vibrio artabrorum TaxID=446374 RepID=A0ABT8CEH8_9VIBR|nr:integrase domain-containing protein [Vibrio artabrorum]MDN3700116.1 integrase domain-containing protein [Vibrio artabrorum]
MAKTTGRITDTKLKNAKPQEGEYTISVGDGLQLRVLPNGTKSWRTTYTSPETGKRAKLSLGTYPSLSFSKAKQLNFEHRQLLAEGIDPRTKKAQEKEQQKALTEHTFINIASEWFKLKKTQVTQNYADDIWRSLERNIFPTLAQTPISQITAPMVIELLRPIEAKGSLETIKRLSQRMNEIMGYAVNAGIIHANPLTNIKAVFQRPEKKHMKAITPQELPELMQAIANANIKKTTRCLLEWQLHTITRPAEASNARWDELDLENEVWIIPAERMKKRKEHRVPLTPQMLDILEVIKPISGHREFIFPSDKDPKKPCNSQTANAALKRMGYGGRLVSHGMRSIASTTLNEQGFDYDVIETCLAHVDKNQVRSAYNRTDYLERRRKVMCWWSEHIEKASRGSYSVTGTVNIKLVV